MLEFLFDLPLLVVGPMIVGLLCLFSIVGLLFVRRRVLPRLRIHAQDSEFSGAMMPSVMVFYGQRGEVPAGGVELMNRFQENLLSFEPSTEGQKLMHGETLRAYNNVILARRLRLDAVNTGLPGVMWTVIILGALIGLTTSFFFKVEDPRLHAIQVLLLALFIGVVIFMIFALDRPFRGDLGLSPDPYQLIYDQLMQVK